MNPKDLTPEELEIWNNSPWNEYGKIRTILALRAVKEMMKHPLTIKQVQAQVVTLFKNSEQPLTPEEVVIWNNAELTEHQRVSKIHSIRVVKKRAEYALQKHQRPVMSKPNERD